jgi:putative ABC transport system substrate-binding protein
MEGRNVAVEYRWAQGHYDRLPELAADLVQRRVAVIVATGGEQAARAAKAVTSTIPIVFGSGDDAVALGLVSSLSRPAGNVTGISHLAAELEAKRLELLREMLPDGTRFGVLLNPKNFGASRQMNSVAEVARQTGRPIVTLTVSAEDEFENAFTAFRESKVEGLVVGSDPFFNSRRDRLVGLALHHRLPVIYEWRDFAVAGGLVSYGTSLTSAYRQFGVYTGRILKGEQPATLPILQPTSFELVVNLKTAKALGLTVPDTMLLRADEVIE